MGQLGENLGNSNVTDPSQANWGDMDSSEKGARLLAGGTKGLLKGFSNMQAQNQQMRQPGPQMPVPMPQQPQVQLPGMFPQGFQSSPDYRSFSPDPGMGGKLRGNNLAFYGGQ